MCPLYHISLWPLHPTMKYGKDYVKKIALLHLTKIQHSETSTIALLQQSYHGCFLKIVYQRNLTVFGQFCIIFIYFCFFPFFHFISFEL